MARTKILIADKDENNLQSFKQTLEDKYDIISASDGQAVWEIIEKAEPEIVILNINLPGEDGIELCQKIKADKKYARLLVVLLSEITGKEDLPDSFWRITTGADAFLSQPIPAQKLRATVENLLARKIGRKEVIGPGYF